MSIGLIGKKIGMTREFFDMGISVPVTVLSIEKGRIIDVITKEKRGYDAIRVGFGKIKTSKITKQMKGVFAKKSTEAKKILKEFRVENIADFKEGSEIGLELFKDQKYVDVTAKTIDKNNINKSPLKTSDQNFFKPYKRPLITIIALLRVHKLHHISLLKINHELLELRLFE